MRCDRRLVEHGDQGRDDAGWRVHRCNATGSAARQARFRRGGKDLVVSAAPTENCLSERESNRRRNRGDRHRLIQIGPIQNAGALR
jgi:hypothetical protein